MRTQQVNRVAGPPTPEEWRRRLNDRLLGIVTEFIPEEVRDVRGWTFDEYCRRTLPFGWTPHPWQEKYLIPLCQDYAVKQGLRRLLHAPPQVGKTLYVSQRLPAYLLGRNPYMKIFIATQSIEWGEKKMGAPIRALMQAPEFEELFPDPAARIGLTAPTNRFSTAGRESMRLGDASVTIVGLTSGFTGGGVGPGDLLIIDDPYASAEDAMSDRTNDKIWELFWQGTASVRVDPLANVLVMFHRYRHNDLAGRLQGEGGWEYVRFPAVADGGEDDPTGREVGELLSPLRSREWLDQRKAANPMVWASQFQGKPINDRGGMFQSDWMHMAKLYGDVLELPGPNGTVRQVRLEQCWTFCTVDWNDSESEKSDWTVCSTWFVTPQRDLVLRSVRREHHESVGAAEMVREEARRWQPTFILGELNTVGRTPMRMLRQWGLPTRGVWQHKKKEERALGASAYYHSGKVFHLEGAPGLTHYVTELLQYPRGDNDDCVDTVAMATKQMEAVMLVFPEFVPHRHESRSPLAFEPELPLVLGWRFGDYRACVATQLQRGQLKVLRAWKGDGSSLYEWSQRISRDLVTAFGHTVDLQHYTLPHWAWTKEPEDGRLSVTTERPWMVLSSGVENVVDHQWNGAQVAHRPALGWVLTGVASTNKELVDAVRERLTLLVVGDEALRCDPDAEEVTQALAGLQYDTDPQGNVKIAPKPGYDTALIEALGIACRALAYAQPHMSEEDEARMLTELWSRRRGGTASGVGRPRF